jgi:hypothetical protein
MHSAIAAIRTWLHDNVQRMIADMWVRGAIVEWEHRALPDGGEFILQLPYDPTQIHQTELYIRYQIGKRNTDGTGRHESEETDVGDERYDTGS